MNQGGCNMLHTRLPKHLVVSILRHRGYVDLRTKQGVKPLSECPEYQLWAVYRSGKVIKPKNRAKS